MPSSLKTLIICSLVVFVCLCIECGDFQMQMQNSNLSEAGLSRKETTSFPDAELEYKSTFKSLPVHFNKTLEENVNNISLSNFSFANHFNNDHQLLTRPKTMVGSKEMTEFAMEGGGIGLPLQNSSVNSLDSRVLEEEVDNKGSKGRKGVSSSSVVPRKGVSIAVDHLVQLPSNNTTTRPMGTFTNNSLVNNYTKTLMDSKASLLTNYESIKPQAKVQMQETHRLAGILNTTHSKKPEYVSDEKDVDDFGTYSIIKTSTTGEDYVIIGIVIVIGIWFSVFGALIFYRRAGEYWDRRHYRRMDFLVEGMYND